MRLHRIELLTDTAAVDLPFHHQTTVVAGLDRLEAEALAQEVVGALEVGRPGLSADLSTHTGRRLEIRRPLQQPGYAVDVDSGTSATADLTISGVLHPLEALGISTSMRVTDNDLASAEQASDRVARLANLDQDRLWGLAITLAELEVEIARQTDDEVVSERIPHQATAEIEQARADVDLAQQRLERLSDQSIVAAASLVLISFAVAFITHPYLSIPFMAAAFAVGWRSWTWHQAHETAIDAEGELLHRFGLESYLDFQLRKVDALTNDTKQRRASLLMAEKRRFVLDQWQDLVGTDISLEWAATHRPTITATAKQAATASTEADAAAMSEAVSLALAERIREASALDEPSPLIVDDIFSSQSDAAIDRLLWLVDHHCQQLQFVLLSSDERVLRWAAARTVARQASILRLTEAENDREIALDAAEPSGALATNDRRVDEIPTITEFQG